MPSNPMHLPGTSSPGAGTDQTPYISSGMFAGILPSIPNLQVGFLCSLALAGSHGYLTMDYTKPVKINGRDVIFGEVHSRVEDPPKTLSGSASPYICVLTGGGYRKRFTDQIMAGINGFYDTARLQGEWYNAAVFGGEIAVENSDNSLLIINCNYYGNLFSGTTGPYILLQDKPGDFRCELAYDRALYDRGPNARIVAGIYRIHRERDASGWNAGVNFSTNNHMLNA